MSNVDSLIALLKTLRMDTAVRISDSQWDACIKLGTNMELKNNQGVVDALIEALEPNNLSKAHAAEAFGTFGNIGDDRVVEKLIVSLKDPYRLVRSYSARALGKQNNEKAIPDLIERLKIDDFFGVRAEAAEALVIICSNSQSTECKKARKELEDAKVRKGQR